MKLFYAVLVVLLLSGCGGGGDSAEGVSGGGSGSGSGGGSGGSSGGGNKPDPLVQYINVSPLYLGNKNSAQVDLTTLGSFFEYLSFVAPELLPDYVDSDSAGFLDGNCPDGGSATAGATASPTEVKLTFSNCKDQGIIYDGIATGRILASSGMDNVTEAQFIFQDLKVSSEFGSYVMRGTMHEKVAPGTCPDSTITFNILLNGLDNKQIFFNDFKFRRAGTSRQSCGDDGIHLSGKVFDSALGVMIYQTTDAFKLDTMFIPPEKGRLVLTGAGNSSVAWSVNSYERNRHKSSYYRTEIDADGDQVFETSYQYVKSLFSYELLTSFVDADQDGMQDAWELLVGLSPTDPSDALLDMDGDGYTNLEEFKYLGHPSDALIKASIANLHLWAQHGSYSYNEVMTADFTLTNRSDVDALGVVVSLTATNATFSPKTNCELAQNDMQLICRYQTLRAGQNMLFSHRLTEKTMTTDAWQDQISVQVSSLSYDPDLRNNQAVVYLSKEKATPDYVIASQINDGPARHFIGLQGESIDYDFMVSNHGSKLKDSRLHLELPALLSASVMSCFDSETQVWVNCDLSAGWPLKSDSLRVRLTLKADQLGVSQLRFMVLNDNFSTNQLKAFQLPVVVGQSSQVLQDLIDAAADGATVVAPEGIYIGGLNLTSKNIRLESATGAEHNFLITKYRYSSQPSQHIRLAKGSDLSGYTIAHHILVEDANTVMEQNIFGKTDWHLDSFNLRTEHSFTFRNNKVIANIVSSGIGNSATDVNGCMLLSFQSANDSIEVTVENNLFMGPLAYTMNAQLHCPSAVMASGNVDLNFHHNTISGYTKALEVHIYEGFRLATLKAYNNIFHANNYAVSAFGPMQEPKLLELDLTNNLYWSNSEDYRGLAGYYVETGKISANPMLNADGSLNFGSPAIDAAFDLGLSTDVNGESRPIDGNGDGIAAPDIGAVEFRP